MVPFAGFEMPIQYELGIQAEHRCVRAAAGLFDVSHMGQLQLSGRQALDLVQFLTVNDAARLVPGQAQYSVFCREDGGVLDDLLVYCLGDSEFLLVVNGANREKDLAWIQTHAGDFEVDVRDETDEKALLAVQGPAAESILAPLVDVDLRPIGFYRFAHGRVSGVPAMVARTGYTGEDGFEVYLPADEAPAIWNGLLEAGAPLGLAPVGLGARDTLRLEMGYSLYGNDLDESHSAIEAGLGWRVKLEKGPFVGRTALARQKEEGVSRRLVGIQLVEPGFPRRGYPVLSEGESVGEVTSGTVSPSLGEGIALAYVRSDLAEPETPLAIRVRDRDLHGVVRRPPFYTRGSLKR